MISNVQRSPTISRDRAIGQLSAGYSRGRATRLILRLVGSFTEPYTPNTRVRSPNQGRPAAMKAIQYERFGGPDVLEYLDLPNPTPGSGQLLIETAAIGVNFPDIRERLGVYNKAETRVGGVQLPQVGGLAVAGTVVAAGPQTSVQVGRKVVALMKKGAYAQLAVAEEALCAVVSDDADLAALAGFAAQASCAHLLLQASTTLRPGESLLVHGAAG